MTLTGGRIGSWVSGGDDLRPLLRDFDESLCRRRPRPLALVFADALSGVTVACALSFASGEPRSIPRPWTAVPADEAGLAVPELGSRLFLELNEPFEFFSEELLALRSTTESDSALPLPLPRELLRCRLPGVEG